MIVYSFPQKKPGVSATADSPAKAPRIGRRPIAGRQNNLIS